MSAEELKALEQRILHGPTLDVIATECFGYCGYGTGRVMAGQIDAPLARAVPGPDGRDAILIKQGCDACSRVQECWVQLRETARELLPELMEELDEAAASGLTGMPLMDEWRRRTGQEGESFMPPPDILLNSIFLKVGAAHTVRVVTGELP